MEDLATLSVPPIMVRDESLEEERYGSCYPKSSGNC